MKIGILTFHRTINYGSELQAMGVYEVLKEHFPNDQVEIIDYNPVHGPLKEALVALYPKSLYWLIGGMKYFLQFHRYVQNVMPISKERIFTNNFNKATSFINKQNYDVIFVGSDTVFEYKKGLESFVPAPPNVFWLPKEIKCKKIGFAVSADKTKLDYFSEEQRLWAGECVNGFDYIGSRDDYTKEVLKFVGLNDFSKVCRVPDPTFYLKIKKTAVRDKLGSLGVDVDKPILGIHVGDDRFSKVVTDHYRAKGYMIVAPRYNKFADISLAPHINPDEWAEVYRYFDLTITDRFHGTIFCLKNNAPFVSVDEVAQYGDEKTKKYSLLEMFGLLDNLYRYESENFNLEEFLELCKYAENPALYELVDETLDSLKAELDRFILSAKDRIGI